MNYINAISEVKKGYEVTCKEWCGVHAQKLFLKAGGVWYHSSLIGSVPYVPKKEDEQCTTWGLVLHPNDGIRPEKVNE